MLGSWLRDHPQDFWDPPAHSVLGSVRTFLGWAAPFGAEALEAEKLLGDFLEEAEQEKEEEEQPQASAGEAFRELTVLSRPFLSAPSPRGLFPSGSCRSCTSFLILFEPQFSHL